MISANESNITLWELSRLRSHPENQAIFGEPEDCERYEPIRASIRENGVLEPLAIRSDGTIVCGHIRAAAARALGMTRVPCRVVSFESYRDEVVFLVRSNTDRRQMTPAQIAWAFHRLKSIPKEQGGTKRQLGRPKKDEEKSGAASGVSEAREDAARILNVGPQKARALERVFIATDVPNEVKQAVNEGKIAPTPAARTVQAERQRQGGTIVDPAPLKAWTETKAAPKKPVAEPEAGPSSEPDSKPNSVSDSGSSDRDRHVAAQAMQFKRDLTELVEAYKAVDGVLRRRPLRSVTGPSEHQQYAQILQDIAMLAWRHIESVHGETPTGRQMTLVAIKGGKS